MGLYDLLEDGVQEDTEGGKLGSDSSMTYFGQRSYIGPLFPLSLVIVPLELMASNRSSG